MGGQVEQIVRPRARHGLEQGRGASPLEVGRFAVVHEAAAGGAQLLEPLLERGTFAELEDEVVSRGAQGLVDPRDHPPQAARAVGRQEPEPIRIAVGAEGRERLVERLAREHGGLRLVQLAEARVEAGLERIRLQQAVAEAVDGRDPRPVELAREVGAAASTKLRANPGAQLTRGPLRVRDDEDRVDVDAVVTDGADEALDEDGGLPGSGSRRDEHAPAGLDRLALLRVGRPLHWRSTRQIGQRSHQDGHSPPLGLCRTLPLRIWPASSPAVSRAAST